MSCCPSPPELLASGWFWALMVEWGGIMGKIQPLTGVSRGTWLPSQCLQRKNKDTGTCAAWQFGKHIQSTELKS